MTTAPAPHPLHRTLSPSSSPLISVARTMTISRCPSSLISANAPSLRIRPAITIPRTPNNNNDLPTTPVPPLPTPTFASQLPILPLSPPHLPTPNLHTLLSNLSCTPQLLTRSPPSNPPCVPHPTRPLPHSTASMRWSTPRQRSRNG